VEYTFADFSPFLLRFSTFVPWLPVYPYIVYLAQASVPYHAYQDNRSVSSIQEFRLQQMIEGRTFIHKYIHLQCESGFRTSSVSKYLVKVVSAWRISAEVHHEV